MTDYQSSFATTADDLRTIARVCRLLDGLPLGIEMAASWVRQLSCTEILHRIEADLDFLQMPRGKTPERHRTLRVVFDASWALLQDEETAVMRHLSIFHGPFTLKAAQMVAGATLPMLAGLVDQSLLQVQQQASGTVYDIHIMLRQYAAEHLAHRPQEQQQTTDAHAQFYTDFVQQRADALKSGGNKSTFNQITEIIDDIRAAWAWCLHRGHLDYIDQSLEGLFYFYWARGWLQEGVMMARQVMETARSASETELLATRAKMWLADFYGWQGQYEEAVALFAQTVASAHKLKAMPELIFALNGLGRIQMWQGAYDVAESTFETCLTIAQEVDDKHIISLTLNALSVTVAEAKMDYQRGWVLLEESLAISRQINDQYGCARALINMGTLAQGQGWIEKAERLYTESLSIYREIGYQHGIGAALNYLGQTAYLNEAYEQAQTLIYESYELHRESGNRRAMINSLKQLGNATREAGNLVEAQEYYREALHLAQVLEMNPIILSILMETAVLQQHHDQLYAVTLLLYIAHHPAAGKELADAAENMVATLLPQQSAENQAACKHQAKTLTLLQAAQLALAHDSPLLFATSSLSG
ncbi:MAG: tetratricopeptide repeat protein [Chloroflexi bacterium]|nr:tetratricopeptide repeat protein [Chloroflexota bacterium]